jgi:hypothetical protein
LELTGHAPHVAAAVAPVVVKNVPTAQSAHTALPVAVLDLPAAHEVHVPPSGPVNPTLQVQAVRATLASGELEPAGHPIQVVATVAPTAVEYVPAAQSVHATMPVAILYLPAAHEVHVPPGPVEPALHVQAVTTVLGLGELELPGHATQVDSSVAPAVAEYFPAAQFTHALATL